MAQKIEITVAPDGRIQTAFAGFEGTACYQEAEQLKLVLAKYGVSSETVEIWPTKSEVEVRRLENTQSAGA